MSARLAWTALAVMLLAGCTTTDKMAEANRMADMQECAAKGGTILSLGCAKVDSLIPLTGPRQVPKIIQ